MDTKKLRQKILDLAIRGKLVPQDPNDEPASVLLDRIRAEKERLIKEGKIKRSKKSSIDDEIEAPFEIPESWEWVTIGDVCETCLGKMLDKQKNIGRPQLYLRNVNVRWGSFDLSDLLQMPFEDDEDERYSICYNDLVVCEGGEPGRCAIWESEEPIKFQKALHRIRCYHGILNQYLQILLRLYSQDGTLEKYFTGSTIKHLTGDSLNSVLFPLPPFAEQQRIADEVERWFAVIDELESNEGDLLKAIDQAKSKILDLAIHGKLVPQDPNDEPAIDLLKRINPKFEARENEQGSNQLSDSWIYCRIQDVFNIAMGCSPVGESLNRNGDGIEFHQGKLCFTELYLGVSNIYTTQSIRLASPNSILLCVRAPVGVVNITEREICIGRGLCSLIPLNAIHLMYGFYALQTFQMDFEQKATGSTFKAIGGDVVKNHIIPLPPLNEQKRIVAKIEELFTVLDSIKESLA